MSSFTMSLQLSLTIVVLRVLPWYVSRCNHVALNLFLYYGSQEHFPEAVPSHCIWGSLMECNDDNFQARLLDNSNQGWDVSNSHQCVPREGNSLPMSSKLHKHRSSHTWQCAKQMMKSIFVPNDYWWNTETFFQDVSHEAVNKGLGGRMTGRKKGGWDIVQILVDLQQQSPLIKVVQLSLIAAEMRWFIEEWHCRSFLCVEENR